ncbi:unnamed protein product [Lactuca virosa]|uniref:Uncharacterized protein n=1 Tax=Lactuca virosa TaxID=75947 RepID=A0AAU9NLW6_9ASTR|nr:unnamed protein product [Lactuca virosa]
MHTFGLHRPPSGPVTAANPLCLQLLQNPEITTSGLTYAIDFKIGSRSRFRMSQLAPKHPEKINLILLLLLQLPNAQNLQVFASLVTESTIPKMEKLFTSVDRKPWTFW